MFRTSRALGKCVKSCQLIDAKISSKRPTSIGNFYSSDSAFDSKRETSLYRQLRSKILACGPITVADYMKEILTNPTGGYYMSKDVFGEKGDFTTSPEISQLFGEMLAIWMTYEWRKISRDPFQVVELGPGRGTLMKDILRTFKQLRLLKYVSIHLVEVSPTLSRIQADNLCCTIEENDPTENQGNSIGHYRKGVTEEGVNVFWYYSVKDVPKNFSVFLAHEFFDALPIHKFQRTEKGWSEVLVDIVEGSDEEKFRYVLSKAPTPASQLYVPADEKRDHLEVCPESLVITDEIARTLWGHGGFALICDYGHNGDKTDTFRAFYQHKLHDPLTNPGAADLTADVDFSAIKRVAETENRLISFGPISQRKFLRNLGIDMRLQTLLLKATASQRREIESGYKMIMDEDKMGECFKFVSLFPSCLKEYFNDQPVAGFHCEERKE